MRIPNKPIEKVYINTIGEGDRHSFTAEVWIDIKALEEEDRAPFLADTRMMFQALYRELCDGRVTVQFDFEADMKHEFRVEIEQPKNSPLNEDLR